jgi:hypothetical protein
MNILTVVKAAALSILVSSMAHAVGSSDKLGSELDYCKVSYVEKTGGSNGTYRGQCENDKPHGPGTVTFYNGDKLTGTFINGVFGGNGVRSSADGNIYEGGWQKGKRHGQGKYTWAQGSSYVGEWIDDKRHGKGVFKWSNGNRFEGEFRDNKRFNGKYYTSTGRVYKCRLGQCK